MDQYHVFCCCMIFFASFFCPLDGFNILVPVLDVTTIYKSVSYHPTRITYAMFVFRKNEECYDVFGKVGRSHAPDAENIYLNVRDIVDGTLSRSDNIVQFRANNKCYKAVFDHWKDADHFVDCKDFKSHFRVHEASETIRYTNLMLTSFENEQKESHFQFEVDGLKIHVKYTDVKVSREEASHVILKKNNGLKEYGVTFSSGAHKDQFMEFFRKRKATHSIIMD